MDESTVLVVEDDEAIGRALSGALRSQGWGVEWATTGGDALARIRDVDLVLLDLGLPDLDGVEVCRRIRAVDAHIPIVILTARHGEVDVVLGLDAGADDYVTKPFRLPELLARVRAHLRRARLRADETAGAITVGDVTIDRDARRVRVAGDEIELRAREFDLLAFLMAEAGTAVTRERIMSEVWDEHWFGSTKTLDMHISALRRKLGETVSAEGPPSRVTTLRGVGYRFELP